MNEELLLQVQGMTCAGCEARVGKVLRRLGGVRNTIADYRTGEVRVVFDPDQTSPASIGAAVTGAGYELDAGPKGSR